MEYFSKGYTIEKGNLQNEIENTQPSIKIILQFQNCYYSYEYYNSMARAYISKLFE